MIGQTIERGARMIFALPIKRPRFPPSRQAFTIIELLVVIAIMGLLIAILMPGLSRARHSAKLTICKSNLSQLGLAVIVYADEHREYIPRGSACASPYDFACADVATSQLWIGADHQEHPSEPVGLGLLLDSQASNPEVYFCPADDSNNLEEELPRIGSELDAYGSYTYRQLDQLPLIGKRGILSSLGVNLVDDVKVPVEALAMDTNSLGPGPYWHTNHNGKQANVLYRDRSVHTFSNAEGTFSIPAESFESPEAILARLDQILVNADYAYRHNPAGAPQIE